MMSNLQNGGHDVRSPLPVAYCSIVRRLPLTPPSACDVIGSLYAIYSSWSVYYSSTFVLVFNFICTRYTSLVPGKTAALGRMLTKGPTNAMLLQHGSGPCAHDPTSDNHERKLMTSNHY